VHCHRSSPEETRDRRERFVAFLEQAGEEVVAVRHPFAYEVFNAVIAVLAQFLREGAVVVDEGVGGAGNDQRRRVSGLITRRLCPAT
jgi:hypothetical protein